MIFIYFYSLLKILWMLEREPVRTAAAIQRFARYSGELILILTSALMLELFIFLKFLIQPLNAQTLGRPLAASVSEFAIAFCIQARGNFGWFCIQ